MRAKVERLRMGLVAGTLLLVTVVTGTFLYSRYKAGKLWLDRAKKRSGVSIERETDGFTYSQSMQGKTIFTLHAAKAFQHTGGTWTLHNVVLTLYGLGGQKPDRADRIYGNEFEWDENKGLARAVGEVQMDLQVPAGIAAGERHSAAAQGVAAAGDAQTIHVRTSGLVFVREFGVAATKDPIEFRYGGMTCVARGAEFTNQPNSLHLLADVKAQGVLRGEPVMLTAERADFERASNTLQVLQPVFSDAKSKARAANAVLHLRPDGSVETAEAVGSVLLDEGTRHVSAARLNATLNVKSQPQTAKFSGGVQLVDDNAARPSRGEAGEVLLRFDSQGRPADATATGGTHMTARRQPAKGIWVEREARAQSMAATFAASGKGKSTLQQVHATGAVTLRADATPNSAKGPGASGAALKTNFAAADELTAQFTQRGQRAMLQNVHGKGHTTLRQAGSGGEEHTSSGDTLDVAFAEGVGVADDQMAVSSAVQQGHVTILSRNAAKPGPRTKPEAALTGTAARASYDAATEIMTLTGEAHLADGETSLTAATVTVDQRTGDAEARGSVVGTLAGKEAQATHLAASRAVLHRASQVAEFLGTDSQKARLWQQASQVEAASIVMDRQRRVLTARPGREGGAVHSVFASGGSSSSFGMPDPAKSAARMPSILRVDSSALEYAEDSREAIFSGPVKIDGATGDVRAQKANVFFAASKTGNGRADVTMPAGGLDRVVVSGNVHIEQPGRQGTGDQLVYKASDGSFVMTGTAKDLPRIVDVQQGTVTGSSLLFRAGEITIVVAGAPATADGKQPRARIETRVRQKSE